MQKINGRELNRFWRSDINYFKQCPNVPAYIFDLTNFYYAKIVLKNSPAT